MKLRQFLTTIFLSSLSIFTQVAFAVPDGNAPRIIHQLENSGQIQTSPTSVQLWWWNLTQQIRAWWDVFKQWLNSLLPAPQAVSSATQTSDFWIKVLFIGALVLVVAAVAVLLWRVWRKQASKPKRTLPVEDEELFLLPPEELRQRAANFAGDGHYAQALRYLYISMLMLMDARGVWHYDVNRTNWEHIAQLSRASKQTELAVPLSDMTRRFDRVHYGNAPCDNEEWTLFQRKYSELEARLPRP